MTPPLGARASSRVSLPDVGALLVSGYIVEVEDEAAVIWIPREITQVADKLKVTMSGEGAEAVGVKGVLLRLPRVSLALEGPAVESLIKHSALSSTACQIIR